MFIERHPIAAGLAAFGIGFLIGSLSGRSLEEDEKKEEVEQHTPAEPSTAEAPPPQAVEGPEVEARAAETASYPGSQVAATGDAYPDEKDVAHHGRSYWDWDR
jgi:hypothetical protein